MKMTRLTVGMLALVAPCIAWAGPTVPLGTRLGAQLGLTLGGALGIPAGQVLPIAASGVLLVAAGSLALGIYIVRRKRNR